MTTYRIRTLRLESGERLPVLQDSATGEPPYEPLLFTMLDLRGTGYATNTLLQALRSVKLLLLVLEALRVNLAERLREGKLLSHTELEALARACSLDLRDVHEDGASAAKRSNVVKMREAVRMRSGIAPLKEVSAPTKTVRLYYIVRYVEWLAAKALMGLEPGDPRHEHLLAASSSASKFLIARMPDGSKRNTEDQRQGLAPKDLARVLEVIEIGHPDNPWRAKTQLRNNLMTRWYLTLGLRRSELLVVRVDDIDFTAQEVLIARRPDDDADPRLDQPTAKTKDRLLPLAPALAKDTHAYVVKVRRKTGNARLHPLLFVATDTGAPLSKAAVNLIFTQLRRKVPDLPQDLTPHVLRHSWNDKFSEISDMEGFSHSEEKRMRSRLMGWSETSDTAVQYTSRHTKQKSRTASLRLQERFKPENGKPQ